ncbi:MAG TPA: hypothetical protein VN843_23910, partial [Anaerolineales bacterium]|nr:hypothetical protein [Anaerolineales bacterium]
MANDDPIKYLNGPSGGILDNAFAYDTSKEHGTDIVSIYQVAVWAGNRIDQLQINWMDSKGNTAWSKPIGGIDNSSKPKEPVIWPSDDKAGEPIIAIQGTIDVYNSLRLFSIQFFTKSHDSLVYGSQKSDDNLNHFYYYQAPPG